ncbi:MAG: tRNA-2-methylthio-N(6)-dimethylallyladenosine synthase [Phycisphaerales bacterium]|nr:MAG: tRNA-2-methylthio-N(6)-dimethylallyladenosine synthase [Phycisphaerales bacterium]
MARVYMETFGCQMNELDSELVAGRLAQLGHTLTARPDEADVMLYNTCSVREQAEQKVLSRLGELRRVKRRRPTLVVGVLGCMAERDGAALMQRMPVVDLMCGPGELDKLPQLLDNAVRTRASLAADGLAEASANLAALQGNTSRRSATLSAAQDGLEMLDLSRAFAPTDPHAGQRQAYVRITRGCNKFCTYCVVPFTRGAEVHRPPEHIIDECKRLADAGVVEVTLLGQTVNHYRFEHGAAVTVGGVTQPQKGRTYKGSHRRDAFAGTNVTTFADLLAQIHERVPAIRRLRFVTSYPRDFGDDVLEVMRSCERICRYLHVPAQSGSDAVLQRMNRGYSVGQYLEFLDRARHFLDQPEIGRPLMLSGDIIVGFPGETDEDYQATVRLVERARYKNCFIFKYSPRPGTVAYQRIPDDVPESVKRQRNNDLLAIQARIGQAIGQEQIGRRFDVLVEGYSQKQLKAAGLSGAARKPRTVELTVGGSTLAGATQPPDVPAGPGPVQLTGRSDGDLIIHFEVPDAARAKALIGQIVPVEVTDAGPLSLQGRLVTPGVRPMPVPSGA